MNDSCIYIYIYMCVCVCVCVYVCVCVCVCVCNLVSVNTDAILRIFPDRWLIGTFEERESRESVLSAQFDDDDNDDDVYMCIYQTPPPQYDTRAALSSIILYLNSEFSISYTDSRTKKRVTICGYVQ